MARKIRMILRSSRIIDGSCWKNPSPAQRSKPGKRPAEMGRYGFQRFNIKSLSYKGLSTESIKSGQNFLKFLFNITEEQCWRSMHRVKDGV